MQDEAATANVSELQSLLKTLQWLERGDAGVAFLRAVVQATMDLAGADHARLAIPDAGDEVRYQQYAGFPRSVVEALGDALSPGAAAVLRSGEAMFVEDYQKASLAHPALREYGVRSSMYLPVRVQGSTVGVLSFGWQRSAVRPAPEREGILASMADQIGVALERQELLRRLGQAESRGKRLERFHSALLAANEVLVQPGDTATLYARICEILVRRAGLPCAWIGRVKGSGLEVATFAGSAQDYFSALAGRALAPEWYGPAAECLRQQEPVVWQQAVQGEFQRQFFARAAAHQLGSAVASLPLRQGDRLSAVLTVFAQDPGFFADDLLLLLHRLADDISFTLSSMETAEQARFFSHYDPLTSLPNEVLLRAVIAERLADERAHGGRLAAMHVAIGDVMEISDTLGYSKGDAALREVADRLLSLASASALVARVGRAEFMMLVGGLRDEEAARAFAASVANRLQEPLDVDGDRMELEVNVGVAYDEGAHRNTAEGLLRRAHMATYRAVAAGPGEVVCFTPEIEEKIVIRQTLREQIAKGLVQREFLLYYQPQVEMQTGRLVGFEALVRWLHPERGLLLPSQFLSAIEGHALMGQLGEFVLDAALSQLDKWLEEGLRTRMNVNIAPSQLLDAQFPGKVAVALGRYPLISPSDLTLEMVESAAIVDLDRTISAMRATALLGVHWALDDFGTGYSSLTHLQRLPVDEVKMDQSFTKAALADITSLSILNGLTAAVLPLRRMLVAEGVEEPSQGTALLDLGCSIGQGFAIAKPMPAEDVPRWLAEWRPDPAWQRARINMRRWDYLLLLAGWQEEEARLVRLAVEALSHTKVASEPPAVDRCRLGVWCSGPGRDHFGGLPLFQEIDTLHHRLHAGMEKMLRLKAAGDEDGATDESFEVAQTSANLIARMEEMYDAILHGEAADAATPLD